MGFILAKLSRLYLFLNGIWWIQKKTIRPDLSKYPKLVYTDKQQSYVICSNHVSFVDIFFYFSQMNSSFISKKEVESYPIIGLIAKSLQCIFLDRLSDQKDQIIEQI